LLLKALHHKHFSIRRAIRHDVNLPAGYLVQAVAHAPLTKGHPS
jgi:hypothetical protein